MHTNIKKNTKRCDGKSSCNQKITTSLFIKVDPCPGIEKTLEINYVCALPPQRSHKGRPTRNTKRSLSPVCS